jgi:nitroreductase
MQVETLTAIRTLRSTRRLRPDPVELEKIHAILEAAGKAPSGSNTQPWDFVLLTNPEIKKRVRDLTVRGLKIYLESSVLFPKNAVDSYLQSDDPVVHLAKNTDKAPVLILVCLNTKRARRLTNEWAWLEEQANWASVFPAVQNMLLAARALGLGSAVSIFPFFYLSELKQILHIPDFVKPGIMVYAGYPLASFREPKRISIENFVHENKW